MEKRSQQAAVARLSAGVCYGEWMKSWRNAQRISISCASEGGRTLGEVFAAESMGARYQAMRLLGGFLVNHRWPVGYGENMLDEMQAVEAGHTTGISDGNGIVFVRWLAPGCWASTTDHRVYRLHRNQRLRAHPSRARIFDCPASWSPDKGIA